MATLRTEGEVEEWSARENATLLRAIKDGPVLIQ